MAVLYLTFEARLNVVIENCLLCGAPKTVVSCESINKLAVRFNSTHLYPAVTSLLFDLAIGQPWVMT